MIYSVTKVNIRAQNEHFKVELINGKSANDAWA